MQTRTIKEDAVVRFAGDSGDGMQLTGNQFTMATAITGNDLVTFPDFPAEIRAPVGTIAGVSSFQIHFGSKEITAIGDSVDILIAMNPAALISNIKDLSPGGLLIVDTSQFTTRNCQKVGYEQNPLENDNLNDYRVVKIDITKMTSATVKAIENIDVSNKEALRAKNMWALGLVLWLFTLPKDTATKWIKEKFKKLPDITKINIAALDAGYAYGDIAELPPETPLYEIAPAKFPDGEYCNITGNDAMCWGLATGAHLASRSMVYCSYPITPASNILHSFIKMRDEFAILTLQAEDEIAAVTAAIGVSYAGQIGVTGSSGPGIALKTEALGLAVAAELPLVVVNVQRGGPSTGLPTKTEQSDLYQAVFGRNADCPLVVLAARSPGDCFYMAIEAIRIATKYMTPVILLSDGYLGNSAEPWPIPDIRKLESFPIEAKIDPNNFAPFTRDQKTLARPWVAPGIKGCAHRIGGIERADNSGHISYDPDNHQKMTRLRAQKILNIANDIEEQKIEYGQPSGDILILGWGSTYGSISQAVRNLIERNEKVSHSQLRHIWPLPKNLDKIISKFKKVIVPEMNNGQLITLLKANYDGEIISLPKTTGKPFSVAEIEEFVMEQMKS